MRSRFQLTITLLSATLPSVPGAGLCEWTAPAAEGKSRIGD